MYTYIYIYIYIYTYREREKTESIYDNHCQPSGQSLLDKTRKEAVKL